jgi:hypothetical protein
MRVVVDYPGFKSLALCFAELDVPRRDDGNQQRIPGKYTAGLVLYSQFSNPGV